MEMHENGVKRRKERERSEPQKPTFHGNFTNILETHSGSLVKI